MHYPLLVCLKILVFMGYITCRTQCVLAVVALCLGLAQSTSWDFAAVSTQRIDYYSNGIVSHSEGISLKYINSIIYDGVSNKMFLVNFTSQILSYDVTSKKFETLVLIKDYTNHGVRSLAYDSVEQKLFWIDPISRTIKWVSLKPGAKNVDGGNTLASLDVDTPQSLAVDSCNGYIYWASTTFDYRNNRFTSKIEKFRLDGGSSEAVVTGIKRPVENSLVVDQNTKKLYWITKEPYEIFHVESADLDGRNKKTLLNGTNAEPSLLAVSEDSLYWVFSYLGIAQKLSKNPSKYEQAQTISVGRDSRIVVNYKLGNEILNCERQNGQSTNNPANIVVPVCHNYCLNGDCTTGAGGQPQCRCKPGFSGDRCEVDLCRGHCLNGGRCSIDKNNKPVCQCTPSFFGSDQCEIPVFLMKTFVAIRTLKDVISLDLPPLPSTCGNF